MMLNMYDIETIKSDVTTVCHSNRTLYHQDQKLSLRILLKICYIFVHFKPCVPYKSVVYKKRVAALSMKFNEKNEIFIAPNICIEFH